MRLIQQPLGHSLELLDYALKQVELIGDHEPIRIAVLHTDRQLLDVPTGQQLSYRVRDRAAWQPPQRRTIQVHEEGPGSAGYLRL